MKIKDVLIVVVLFFVFCIVVGLTGDSSDTSEKTVVQETVQPKTPDFSTQLQKEIDKKNLLSDATIMYTPSTKYLSVKLSEDAYWNGEQLCKGFAIDTCDIMIVASAHPNEIVGVTITGYAPVMDTKGNEVDTKVYQAQIESIDADVNWDNLKISNDKLGAIQNNFDAVWWHPAVLG